MPDGVLPPELRRIAVAEAHRRRTGRCPTLLHSLGTGESFPIEPRADGLTDTTSGLRATLDGDAVEFADRQARLVLTESGDVALRGIEVRTGARFAIRAGGGSSVTFYEEGGAFFQYGVEA